MGGPSTAEVRPGSILQALERPDAPPMAAAKAPASRTGWKIGAVALVLLSGLAWTQWQAHNAPPLLASTAAPEPLKLTPAPTPAQAASVPAPAAAASQAPAAAALIEELGLPAVVPSVAASAVETISPAMAPTARPAAEAPVTPPVLAAATPPKTDRPKTNTPSKTSTERRSLTAERSTKPTTPTKTARSNSRGDTDVEIVTALMTHLEGKPNGTRSARAAERPVPSNIAELVGSCQSGSTDEALACRARICKGYWGKANACPSRDRKPAERAANKLNAPSP